MILSSRISLPFAVLGAVVLTACSSSSKSSGETTQTTAAKADSKQAEARAEAFERLDKSTQVITQVGDKIPDPVASRSQCVVSVPSMVKGGVIIGGEHGKGFASCRTAQGWSPPAPITISGGTIGAQLGVQSTDLLALVTSGKGTKALLGGNFKVGADASATAGPVGTGRGSGNDVAADTDMVSYSQSKGLFAGAELNGATITPDNDTAKALYGTSPGLGAILEGRVAPLPDNAAPAQRFQSTVAARFGQKK